MAGLLVRPSTEKPAPAVRPRLDARHKAGHDVI